jgi:Cysteine-rich CWC
MKLLIEKESCPSCKADFQCSKSKRCWCYELDVNIDELEALEGEYPGCLCPACLGKKSR